MQDFIFKTHAQTGILQPLDHGLGSSLVGPGRNDTSKVILSGAVRINISLNFSSLRPGLSKQLNGGGHLAPQAAVSELQVYNLHRQVSSTPDLDRLTDGAKHANAFGANVSGVDSTVS